MRYVVSGNMQVFANVYNVNDAKYGGISAVNDIGVLRGNDSGEFSESLYLNPQYGVRFTLGVDVTFLYEISEYISRFWSLSYL